MLCEALWAHVRGFGRWVVWWVQVGGLRIVWRTYGRRRRRSGGGRLVGRAGAGAASSAGAAAGAGKYIYLLVVCYPCVPVRDIEY